MIINFMYLQLSKHFESIFIFYVLRFAHKMQKYQLFLIVELLIGDMLRIAFIYFNSRSSFLQPTFITK